VSKRTSIPTNAIIATLTFTVLLSLVLIGSDTAFNIIASLGASAILSSYIISITCISYRKITGYKLPKTRFPLGKFGLPINILALCFLWLAFVLVFFPAEPSPTIVTMNWSCLIYGAVVLFALIAFATNKRHSYHGPVKYVRDEDFIVEKVQEG
jgi:amino acid transporter